MPFQTILPRRLTLAQHSFLQLGGRNSESQVALPDTWEMLMGERWQMWRFDLSQCQLAPIPMCAGSMSPSWTDLRPAGILRCERLLTPPISFVS